MVPTRYNLLNLRNNNGISMYFLSLSTPEKIAFALTVIFAFAYHEFAHAIVADRLGDPTPRQHGRMSLNPIRHLDALGLILLFVLGFGWAVTPINPNMLRGNPRKSMMYVAVAGPLANLLMAVLFALPIRFGIDSSSSASILPTLYEVLSQGMKINLILLAFNLIPVPPLDGFTILLGLLPGNLAYQLQGLQRFGTLLLFGLLFLPLLTGFDIIGFFIREVLYAVGSFLIG